VRITKAHAGALELVNSDLDYGGEKMEQKTMRNKVFDTTAWGTFIVLLGVGWIISNAYQVSTTVYIALGVGLILIALNLARYFTATKISKFSLFVGLIALALSGSGIVGYELPFIPTLIVLIGMFVVAEAVQNITRK
jgi:uncharacterized membrane protein